MDNRYNPAASLGIWEGEQRKSEHVANYNQLIYKLFIKIRYILSFWTQHELMTSKDYLYLPKSFFQKSIHILIVGVWNKSGKIITVNFVFYNLLFSSDLSFIANRYTICT